MNLAQATLKHPRCWGHCSLQPRPPHCCVFALPAPGPTEALLRQHPCWHWYGAARGCWGRGVPAGEVPCPGPTRKAGALFRGGAGNPLEGGTAETWGAGRAATAELDRHWCCPTQAWRAGPGAAGPELRPPTAVPAASELRQLQRLSPGPGRSRSAGSAQVLCGRACPAAGAAPGAAVPLGAEGPAAAACGRPLAHLPTCLFTVWPCLGGTRARAHPGAQASAAPRPWATPRWGQVCRRWGCGRGERGGLAGRSWVWRGPQQDGSFTPGPRPW